MNELNISQHSQNVQERFLELYISMKSGSATKNNGLRQRIALEIVFCCCTCCAGLFFHVSPVTKNKNRTYNAMARWTI